MKRIKRNKRSYNKQFAKSANTIKRGNNIRMRRGGISL